MTDIDPAAIEAAAKAMYEAHADFPFARIVDWRDLDEPLRGLWIGFAASAAPLIARSIREQVARAFRTADRLAYTADEAAHIALTGEPPPTICGCGHDKKQHSDMRTGWTAKTMFTVPNGGRCQDCACLRYTEAAIARGGLGETGELE